MTLCPLAYLPQNSSASETCHVIWLARNLLPSSSSTQAHNSSCVLPGFRYMEKAQPHKNISSTSTNHVSVCLLYGPTLCTWRVELHVFSTFEVVAMFVHRTRFNAVIIIVYHLASNSVMQSFFDNFGNCWRNCRHSQHCW